MSTEGEEKPKEQPQPQPQQQQPHESDALMDDEDAVATAEAAVAAAAQLASEEQAQAQAQQQQQQEANAAAAAASAEAPRPPGDNNGGGGGGNNDEDDDDDDDEEVKPTIEVEPNDRATSTKRLSDVGERDVVLNSREDNHKMFLFLEDLVHMYAVLWTLQGKVPEEADLDRCSAHIVQLLKAGKRYELGGIRDVPRPCLKSPGRVLERDDKGAVREVSDQEAAVAVRKMIVDRASHGSIGDIWKESPYKEYKQRLERNRPAQQASEAAAAATAQGAAPTPTPHVESGDLVLVSCKDEETETEQRGETKIIYNMGPQQLVFNLAAQIVTMYTINAETQVKAALAVLNGLDEAHFVPLATPSTGAAAADGGGMVPRPSTSHPRFLLRSSPQATPEGDTAPIVWSLVSEEDIVEWAVTFVFEVHLEKDLDYMYSMLPENHATRSSEGLSKTPIKEPTAYDVLFGRGGMTNSHVGTFVLTGSRAVPSCVPF
jgi:hypothetical protein